MSRDADTGLGRGIPLWPHNLGPWGVLEGGLVQVVTQMDRVDSLDRLLISL